MGLMVPLKDELVSLSACDVEYASLLLHTAVPSLVSRMLPASPPPPSPPSLSSPPPPPPALLSISAALL